MNGGNRTGINTGMPCSSYSLCIRYHCVFATEAFTQSFKTICAVTIIITIQVIPSHLVYYHAYYKFRSLQLLRLTGYSKFSAHKQKNDKKFFHQLKNLGKSNE